MKELMLMYHPVKKEIRFLAKAKGEFVEIPYSMCPWLSQYGPDCGEFLLQNQGNKFFDDIWEQFLRDKVKLVFKGTKIDFEDFEKKVAEYNSTAGEERFKISKFIELPKVADIYDCISDFCDSTISVFDSELQDSDIKKSFLKRREEFEMKRAKLNNNDVNLCLVGTYSSGKSTFINALIGRRILPESINSETAKMFRIRNCEEPSVEFIIKNQPSDIGIIAKILWVVSENKFEFVADVKCESIRSRVEDEINSAVMFRLQQHEQLYQILKKLNDIPNHDSEKNEEYIDGIIDVNFPIPIDKNINFTFYDTPGTDSNSNEHLLVLKKALQQQTNSILIVLYEPTKMEGTGNSILYNLINNSRTDSTSGVTIDMSRSLHIINQADTKALNDLNELRNKKVEVTLKETDKIYNEESTHIDLGKERLFFVSSKAAYISKAIAGDVDTEDERRWLANHKNEINNEAVIDPFADKKNARTSDVETGMYFKLDKLAGADAETKQLIADCKEELVKCDETNSDDSLYQILHRIYVNSGMYAIEQEIIKYAQKYALAVKAKGLYDGIKNVVNFIREDYEVVENQARLSKEQIAKNIELMKTNMVKDIMKAQEEYIKDMTTENLVFQIDSINTLYTVMNNRQIQAGKIADKMKWIALRPEVFEEKNNIIRVELNRYLQEIDDYYKANRGAILQQQINELKNSIVKKIEGYKGIDEGLIRRITNVSDTQVPPSSLKALKMDEYINKQKAIFIFSTNDKKSYKNDVETMFASTTKEQFDSYISEITEVAKKKTVELVEEFKNNIDIISTNLELLIKDEEKASFEQNKAREVLKLVDEKDVELNKKIWGEE